MAELSRQLQMMLKVSKRWRTLHEKLVHKAAQHPLQRLADRIIFSVDYPFSTNEQGRKFLDNASISPADREKISHLNAERLLRLEQA